MDAFMISGELANTDMKTALIRNDNFKPDPV